MFIKHSRGFSILLNIVGVLKRNRSLNAIGGKIQAI